MFVLKYKIFYISLLIFEIYIRRKYLNNLIYFSYIIIKVTKQ